MALTPASIAREIRDAGGDFRGLVDQATTAELRGRTIDTKWTNDQLLFHMLFGYLVVRTLLWLVRGFSRFPDRYSRRFAQALNAATRLFHVVNYLGSLYGARVLGYRGMERVMDNVTQSLIRTVERATEEQLSRGMHFPVGWDPYFRDFMTVQDVLHYATQHYQHHRRQLTLSHANTF
ncbi:MAG: DinB family protein [Dermatophilaceae bacterium]